MKINQIALRQKESHLFASTTNQMSIKILNTEPKIISKEKNKIHIIKWMTIQIMNQEDEIANFIVGVQCEVELDKNEMFNKSNFDNMMIPFFYSHMNQMISEMNLPAFPISVLYDSLKRKLEK